MADDFADATASSIGGVLTVAVTYPIEIVKNRIASATSDHGSDGAGEAAAQKQSGSEEASALAVARGILSSRGVLGFYDGVTVSALENAVEKFLYFYAYSALRRSLQALRGGPSMIVDLAAGCLAELAHLPFSVPFETLLVRVVNNPEKGALAIMREQGFASLYQGTMASAVLSIKPAIQLATYEATRARLLKRWQATALSAGHAFLLGAFARAFATILVFPYIRAKFMLKNEKSLSTNGSGSSSSIGDLISSMHRAMALVVERQGLGGLYKGLPEELARATTSAALLMAVRERLTLVLKAMLLRQRQSK